MAATFSVWDYVVFSLMLAISLAIGFYHALVGGKQQTTSEFLLADRSLSALPVALSVLASFFSASTLLGTPAEIYLRGTQYWMSVWGAMIAPLVGAFIFGPFLHRMKLVSVFQYLEMRYQSKLARTFGAILFIIRATLGMGIVLFGPAVSLNAVTGFPTWAVIILIGVICIVYTTLGGMKAVIWTDVFQTFIMLAGMLAVVIQGTIAVGGFGEVWRVAEAGGRIQFFDFDPDPTVRHTFWTLVVGSLFVWMPPYTIDQQMIQRFSSTRSLNQAVWALLLNIPGMFIIITLCSLSGLVMYAYYADCDPIDRGTVHDPNQLLPRFVMDVLGFVPGLPGLFVASLFSGAFSSVSSMLNSLAAVTWEDFLKQSPRMRRLSDKEATYVNKGLVVVFAVLGVAMAFVFSLVGGTVLQMSMAFNGAAGAPLVGIFLLGVFFPCANWIGVIIGGALGCALPMWISVGAYVTKPPVMRNLPRSVTGCVNTSYMTTASLISTVVSTLEPLTSEPMTLAPTSSYDGLPLYTLSYLWYTATGIIVTVITGLAVSALTNRFIDVSVEPNLTISFVDKFCCCLPLSWRQRGRCGNQLQEHEEKADSTDQTSGLGNADGTNTKL